MEYSNTFISPLIDPIDYVPVRRYLQEQMIGNLARCFLIRLD